MKRYLTAAVCARLADEGARVSIVLLCLARTGSPALGGLLVAALMVPHVVAAPLAGAAADFFRRRKPVYLTAFLAYGVLLLLAASLIGHATLVAAAALVLAGCCAPLMIGGLSSLVAELAPDQAERAFALDASTYGVAGIAGPAVAAVIAGLAGAEWSMVALFVLVALGGAVLATQPLPVRPQRGAWPGRGVLLAAVPVMWRRPSLGAITVGTTLYATGMGALPLVAALLATRAGHTALTGVILSVTACGGLAVSLICARFPIRLRPELVLLACVAASAAPFVILAVVPAGWPQLPFFLLAGALGGPISVAQFAVRDRESPPQVRTQVFTLGAGLKVTGAAAGAALAGVAAGAGPGVLLLGIAACQVAGFAAGTGLLAAAPRHPSPAEARALGHPAVAGAEEYR